jgi:protein-tyrosine phosphatase
MDKTINAPQMFGIFNKKYDQPLFEGLCDFHNHLLPGIDDGSKSVGMSVEMLRLYDQLGFSRIIATPHVYQELYPNTPETIGKAFTVLSQELATPDHKGLRPDGYGAEYMVDETFLAALDKGTPQLLIDGRYILVEMHFFGQTSMIEAACFGLCQQNLYPILAHPERYNLIDKLETYRELKNKGFYLQLNALSLMGHYGPAVKEKAQQLLAAGLYDFVATDAHHPGHLQQLQKLTLTKKQGVYWEAIAAFQKTKFGV